MSFQYMNSKDGVPLPIARVTYGASLEGALSGTATAALSVNATNENMAVRLYAIGCGMFFVAGASSVAAPTLADGYVPPDGSVETFLDKGETHLRLIARSGTGSYRIEKLR